MMPAIHSMRFAVKPSRSALMIGTPPATAASNATITLFSNAAANISVPCFASKALLAVTTCLPLAIAFSTSALVVVSPPINSQTMSMSGWLTNASALGSSSMPSSEKSRGLVTSRAVACVTRISRPARREISSRLRFSTSMVPEPTVPRPSSPTLMGFMLRISSKFLQSETK